MNIQNLDTGPLKTALSATNNSLQQTESLLSAVGVKINQARSATNSVRTLVRQVKGINSEISSIKAILEALDEVPEGIGTMASALSNAIGIVQDGLSGVVKLAGETESRLNDLLNNEQQAGKLVSRINNQIATVTTTIDNLELVLEFFELLITALGKIKSEDQEKELTEEINKFFNEQSLKEAVFVNKVNVIRSLLDSTASEINAYLQNIEDITNKLTSLSNLKISEPDWMKECNQFISDINSVLNHKICVPYSFKVKVKVKVSKKKWWEVLEIWKWKWQVHTKNFCFTIHQILNGLDNIPVISALEKEANKLVSKVLKRYMGIKDLIKLPQPIQNFEKDIQGFEKQITSIADCGLEQVIQSVEEKINEKDTMATLDLFNKIMKIIESELDIAVTSEHEMAT